MDSKIMLIAPYLALAEEAARLNLELNYDVIVKHAYLPELPRILKGAKEKQIDVIVSRGGIALKAAQLQDGIPVVQIPITGFDVIEAMEKGKQYSRNIALVGFANIVQGVNRVAEIMRIPKLVVAYRENATDCSDKIRLMKQQGVDVIIGDSLAVKTAEELGLRGILIQSGREGLLSAYEEGIRICRVKRRERVHQEQLRTILNSTYNGIIAVDKQGLVTIVNPQAEKIIGKSSESVNGQHYAEVLPWLNLDETLSHGKSQSQVLLNLGRMKVILNKVPIVVNKEVCGAVTTLQEINQIQEAQQKLKEELLKKGHVARATFEQLIGKAARIKEAIEQARAYSRVESVVLIEGESGVGKELFAQAIHNESPRAGDPFVAVNCAAIPANLLESELFGYVRGAFTDARREGKAGLFEMAEGGTLFLDEIGEIAPQLQAKLLRVLQEEEIRKVGDDRVTRVNVRVIAATNQSLRELVEQRLFRADLFYRLNILTLMVPPLRERRTDIPLLIDYFLFEFKKKYSRPSLSISDTALNLLQKYNWPGNVRELSAAIERGVVRAKGDVIEDAEFKELLETKLRNRAKDLDMDAFLNAMILSRGNKTKASTLLGIDRTTLWRHLKKWGNES
ncbi:MAG: sigma 54-interacting transcriptional regulator [Desulfitobacteriaceae bacterium]